MKGDKGFSQLVLLVLLLLSWCCWYCGCGVDSFPRREETIGREGPGMGVMLAIQNRILSQPRTRVNFLHTTYHPQSDTGIDISARFLQVGHDRNPM